MNPIQKKIAGGMSPLQAFLTDATCGEPCWEARDIVCRCSCGGENHGCMLNESGVRPGRTAKIDGYRYKLVSIDKNYGKQIDAAKALNTKDGPCRVDKISDTLTYRYWWNETMAGAPARVKPASKSQMTGWTELQPFKDIERWERAYLLWVRL